MSVSLSAQLHALFIPFYKSSSQLCTYVKPFPIASHCDRNAHWSFILFLLLGTIHVISGSQMDSASSIPTHSNFFRAVSRGRHRVLLCQNDPNFCSNPEKNPWGGAVCCFGRFCKDVTADPNHCGGCGRVCGYELVCCDGKCVDVRNDPQRCGACFEECLGKGRCSYAMCDYGQ